MEFFEMEAANGADQLFLVDVFLVLKVYYILLIHHAYNT